MKLEENIIYRGLLLKASMLALLTVLRETKVLKGKQPLLSLYQIGGFFGVF